MSEFLLFGAILVLAAVAGGLLRLLHGSAEDRLMSAQLLGTGGIAVALLLGAAENSSAAVDLALSLALLAAFASAAFINAVTKPTDDMPQDDLEA